MKVGDFLCVVLLAGVLVNGAAVKKAKNSADVVHQVDVVVQLEEVISYVSYPAILNCDYSISSGKDLPVTVTWFVGDGPRFMSKVFSCNGYTKAGKTCLSSQVHKAEFQGRMWLHTETPSLVVSPVKATDNHNFWCQVSLEGSALSENGELGVDAKSVVLRVRAENEMPKFNSVSVDDGNVVTHVGDEVTVHCVCSGSHCDDVFWYKGPVNSDGEFELVYSREAHWRPVPTEYHAYNRWTDRASLYGNSLVISNAQATDAGRYWCEMRSSGFYAIGEMATDAKSVVVEVHPGDSSTPNTFSCLGEHDGQYSDPEDCNGYYECFGGQTFHRSCAEGTVFNPDPAAKYTCDFVSNVAPPCGKKGN